LLTIAKKKSKRVQKIKKMESYLAIRKQEILIQLIGYNSK